MADFDFYIGMFLAAIFVAMIVCVIYSVRKSGVPDDDGPVSGWGTPEG